MPSYTVSISASATLVAAPTATARIKILGYQITSAGDPGAVTLASNITERANILSFNSGGGGISCPPVAEQSEPYFICNPGEDLKATLTNAVATSFNIQYSVLNLNG